jgi:hypothetical protein
MFDIEMFLNVMSWMIAPSIDTMPIPAFPALVMVMFSKRKSLKSPSVSVPN